MLATYHQCGLKMQSQAFKSGNPLQLQLTLSPPRIKRSHRQSHHRSQNATVLAAATTVASPSTSVLSVPRNNGRMGKAQQAVLDAIKDVKGRGKSGMTDDQQAAFDAAVAQLEAAGGVTAPTTSPLLEGRWRLLFTTRPGTASPIQRSFTSVEKFSVFQEIDYSAGPTARVNNIVDFGANAGVLKVEAEGSTDSRPIPGFTPRSGATMFFGILGTSSTNPPAKPNLRIDFQFDKAAFYFNSLPFTIPYPVPFKALASGPFGDEVKGWLDITYLSPDGKFRLSRGNKGTLFVLVKDEPPKEQLLEAISANAPDIQIEELIEGLCSQAGGVKSPARNQLAVGKWRLRWTKQGGRANPLQKLLARRVLNWQIVGADGELENRVQLAPGVNVRALASCEPDSNTRTGVDIEKVVLEAGPLKFDLPVKTDGRGFVDWLYLDGDMRITQGSKGSLFVHTRDE